MTQNAAESRLGQLPPRGELLRLFGFVVLVNIVGAVPAALNGPNSEWFESLAKPRFYPPAAAFGIAWTLLFTLLGVALYLVTRHGLANRSVQLALGLFVIQMALNVAWTPTFFTLQSLTGGLAVITALAVVLIPTAWAFARVDRRAGALFVPYIAWVFFAAVLNYQILVLN